MAIAEEAAMRSVGTTPNREESIRRLVKKLNEGGEWTACYEAGPTGYTLSPAPLFSSLFPPL